MHSNKRRILIVHNSYLQRGGEDSVVESEIKLLSQVYSVRSYLSSSSEMPTGRAEAAISAIWNNESRSAFIETIREFGPDLIHFHNTFPLLSPSVIYEAAKLKIPSVQTLHNYRLMCINGLLFRDGNRCENCVARTPISGIIHACYRGSYPASIAASVIRLESNYLSKSNAPTAYICPTEFLKETYIRHGVSPKRLFVKPHFTEEINLNIKRNGDYAVFVGRLDESKGIDLLVDAWLKLKTEQKLIVIGSGPLYESLLDRRIPNIEFVGHKSKNELMRIVSESKFLVYPSKVYESFGMSVIEGFAVGTPAIVPKQGATSELVIDQYNGAHFENGDVESLARVIQFAFDNEAEVEKWGANSKLEYERKYTPSENVKIFQEIYNEVITRFKNGG